MDSGYLNLLLKMIQEDYKLDENQIVILGHRLMADDKEFEKVWKQYKNKNRNIKSGVDPFKALLQELIS